MYLYNKEDINWNKNEIRQRKDKFLKSLFIMIVLEIFAVSLTLTTRKVFIIAVILIPLFIIYSIAEFCSKKMIYDDKGITFIEFPGKRFFYPWDKIVSIERSLENPLVDDMKQPYRIAGNILREHILTIEYYNKANDHEFWRCNCADQTGIGRFVDYVSKNQNQDGKFKDSTRQ